MKRLIGRNSMITLANALFVLSLVSGIAGAIGFFWRIGLSDADSYSDTLFLAINIACFAGLFLCIASSLVLVLTPLKSFLNASWMPSALGAAVTGMSVIGAIGGPLGIIGFIVMLFYLPDPDLSELPHRIFLRLFICGLSF